MLNCNLKGLSFETIVIVDVQNDNELMRNERNINFNRVIEIKKKAKKKNKASLFNVLEI